MICVRVIRRQLSKTSSNNTIIISIVFVAFYVCLLQIIVSFLTQFFKSNTYHQDQVDEKNRHLILSNTKLQEAQKDNDYQDDGYDAVEMDLLNFEEELRNDVRSNKVEKKIEIKNDQDILKVSKHKEWFSEESIIERTTNCTKYFEIFPALFLNKQINNYEKNNLKPSYSIAFSHLVHEEIAIYETFLSMYFHPNDFYCVHVDKSANQKIWKAVEGLIKCYSTQLKLGKMILVNKNEAFKVRWGQDQMLKADLKCIEKLLKVGKSNQIPWRYSISMAGSELPLVTYASLHKTLSTKLGEHSSALESFRTPNFQLKTRLRKKYSINCTVCPTDENMSVRKWKDVEPLQYSFTNPLDNALKYKFQVFKGLRSVILSVKDANFMVHNPVSKQIYKWLDHSSMSEEHYYSSLIRIKVDTKTSIITQDVDTPNEDVLHGLCIRYTHWYFGERMGGKTYKRKACFGDFIHAICNYNLFDLQKLNQASEKCLIGNKFSLKIDPLAVVVHWSNIVSESFQQLDSKKYSRNMKEYIKGIEIEFSKNYHDKMIQLISS